MCICTDMYRYRIIVYIVAGDLWLSLFDKGNSRARKL